MNQATLRYQLRNTAAFLWAVFVGEVNAALTRPTMGHSLGVRLAATVLWACFGLAVYLAVLPPEGGA